MSTSIHCRYTGALHCEAEHGPSGSQLHTDAPSDHAGLGEGFAPTDLVATALGTCVLTIMGIAAKERGWDLEGAELSVEKTMQPEPRRIASLELSITLLPGDPAFLLKMAQAALDWSWRTQPHRFHHLTDRRAVTVLSDEVSEPVVELLLGAGEGLKRHGGQSASLIHLCHFNAPLSRRSP